RNDARARINRRTGEVPLPRVYLARVFPTSVHRDDYDIGALAKASNVIPHQVRIQHGDTIVPVSVVAVGLVVSIGQKAKPDAVSLDHCALVGGLGGDASPYGGDAAIRQPIQSELEAVAAAVPGVIVCGGDDIDASREKGLDHLRLSFEHHPP